VSGEDQAFSGSWRRADHAVRRLNIILRRLPAERFKVGRVWKDTRNIYCDAQVVASCAASAVAALEAFMAASKADGKSVR